MMGFATIDVDSKNTVTVWLTARLGTTAVDHVNAVTSAASKGSDFDLVEQMVADHAILVTPRTGPDMVPFHWPEPVAVDVRPLAEAAIELEPVILEAFEERRTVNGKENLVEPTFAAVPQPLDAAVSGDLPLALTVANHFAQTWRAWLHAENERYKRRNHMPAGYRTNSHREFPEEFGQNLHPLAVRVYR